MRMNVRFYQYAIWILSVVFCTWTWIFFSVTILQSGIDYPFGPDPSIWGKAALLAKFDAPQTVPPAFPELVALLAGQDGLVQGVLRANVFSMVLCVLGCFLGSAWLVKERISSLFVGSTCAILAIYTFPVYPYAYYFQPDVMALGVIAMSGAGLVGLLRYQSRRSLLFCGFWLGLAFSTREHGLVLSFSAILLLGWVLRFRKMLLVLLGIQIGGGLGAGAPHLPFFRPHGGLNGSLTKAQVALMDTISQRTENNVTGQTQYEQEAQVAQGFWEFVQNMVGQSVEKSSDFHSALLILLIGCGYLVWQGNRRTRIISLIAVAPLLASLLVWTQWRHFFVMLPIMTILGWGGLGHWISVWFRGYGVVFLCGYGIYFASILYPYQQYHAGAQHRNLISQQKRYQDQIALAKELREQADERSLIMAEPILSILTGLAPIHLEGAEIYDPVPPQYPNFVYWTYVVSRKQMGRRWDMTSQKGKYFIYQSQRPEGITENCLKGFWDGPIVEKLPPEGVRLRPKPADGC